jgi:predicted acyltransferase
MEQTNELSKKTERLMSLDALRGFDMFWIIGGGAIFEALAKFTNWPALNWWAGQLEHKYWEGFNFEDLIFPMFLFIAGVSIPLSINKRLQLGHSRTQIYRHAITRLFLLIVLGFLLANGGIQSLDFSNYRYTHVLMRIGIGCFFATIIFLNTKIRGQILWAAGLLLGYWAILKLIPVPGYGAGVMTPEGNFAGYIDRLLLPGKFFQWYFPGILDPEGLLGHISGVTMGLLGVLAGQFLMKEDKNLDGLKKALYIGAAGILFLGIGLVWDMAFPIIKKIWTSSFVVFAAGWSLILLSIFYLIIDVWKLKKWSFFFVVIGSNSIFIYACQSGVFDLRRTSEFFFNGLIKYPLDVSAQAVIASIAYLLVSWLFLYFMYKRKIFFKF